MERLTEVAHVSKRTFYQHFPSKDALVEVYLRRFDTEAPLARERVLDDERLAPRERLLALFEAPTSGSVLRGCPFHNARGRRGVRHRRARPSARGHAAPPNNSSTPPYTRNTPVRDTPGLRHPH
ncbi:TetR/AcrR family transcriptional regulator [Actinomadura soli]|uniref:TetR/AcrR family transcriptional regulator n=1 Tax=Actinomadura soli TaxID=2508997 RepID=A0A5C4J2T1_9ACTN|nr:TetR/AcrR family transcriptional regulator [Actinomadura soli]